jgi:hypothetical protein
VTKDAILFRYIKANVYSSFLLRSCENIVL